MQPLSFQNIITRLKEFWDGHGCSILESYDSEVGAGTLHPATALCALGSKPHKFAYVQASRRPKDSRYGENPNRLSHYYQFQVLLKPAPDNIQELCIKSLAALGIDYTKHDIRFVEDDWENPSIGAWGLGWELWCDGMEVLQFTYMQQIGEIECELVPGELTYGLERLAMYIQNVDHFKKIRWNCPQDPEDQVLYGDLFTKNEQQTSSYCLEVANIEILQQTFQNAEKECEACLEKNLPLAAYHQTLKACNSFNILDARGALSVTERASYMGKVRNLAKKCCQKWIENL